MSPSEIAALATASAALTAAVAQWVRLFGPRRNGGRAVIRYFEERLAAAEAALADCLEQVHPSHTHRTRPDRWR